MKYALFNENGHLEQYVHIEDDSEIDKLDMPAGWTLRDPEGIIVQIDDEWDRLTKRLQSILCDALDVLEDMQEARK